MNKFKLNQTKLKYLFKDMYIDQDKLSQSNCFKK